MSKQYWTDEDYFYKSYKHLSPTAWRRFLRIVVDFSDASISPRLVEYDDKSKLITWEKITPLNTDEDEEMLSLFLENGYDSARKVKDEIRIKVARMREIGYIHGDLHMNNIGMKNGNFYIFDLDTVVKEHERDLPSLIQFMEEMDTYDFDEYAERDWIGWTFDVEAVFE